MVRIFLFVVSVTTLLMIQSIQGDSGGKVTVSVMTRKKKRSYEYVSNSEWLLRSSDLTTSDFCL
jgi:hypothetical protein